MGFCQSGAVSNSDMHTCDDTCGTMIVIGVVHVLTIVIRKINTSPKPSIPTVCPKP